MATQPTKNPVPSESPRDLKFNAGKIDEFVTSPSGEYTDRLGGRHKTIRGMEADFENQLSSQSERFNTQLSGQAEQFTDQITSQSDQFNYFIQNSGYEVVGDYEDGPLTINSYNQIIRCQGSSINSLEQQKSPGRLPAMIPPAGPLTLRSWWALQMPRCVRSWPVMMG